jgi:4-hydroxy-tetrahydrodipicolinate synthase
MIFQGAFTAIATPFTESGELNETELRKFIQFQIQSGISGLVPCGTTGESPTMSKSEKKRVIEITLEEANGKIPIIAGTGNYNTAETIEATKEAKEMGVSGALVITPYYNKPTQKGLYLHFREVANAVPDIDIIIYNVPSRTNICISPEIVEKLVNECPNITTIKDATGDLSHILDLKSRCGNKLTILSGEDALIWPYIACGAKGVISVVSNVRPKETLELTFAGLNNNVEDALEKQIELNKLIDCLFVETNPIPVKFMLNKMGFNMKHLRLPLHELSEEYHTLFDYYL